MPAILKGLSTGHIILKLQEQFLFSFTLYSVYLLSSQVYGPLTTVHNFDSLITLIKKILAVGGGVNNEKVNRHPVLSIQVMSCFHCACDPLLSLICICTLECITSQMKRSRLSLGLLIQSESGVCLGLQLIIYRSHHAAYRCFKER